MQMFCSLWNVPHSRTLRHEGMDGHYTCFLEMIEMRNGAKYLTRWFNNGFILGCQDWNSAVFVLGSDFWLRNAPLISLCCK